MTDVPLKDWNDADAMGIDACEIADASWTRPAPAKKSKFQFTLYKDIDRAPRKIWLVENLLGDGEASCDFGPPGCGKSVLAGDRAAQIAAGLAWFGRRVTKGSVLYVAAERAALVKRRFAAFRLHHGLDDLPLAIISGAIDLRNSHFDADEIIDCARRLEDKTGHRLRLIEIDTVSRVLAGGDENSPRDMGLMVRNIARIQEATGGHVNVLHHVPHGQDRMRGHGVLLAAMDTTIHVENKGAVRTATVAKTNDGAEGECLAFTLRSIELHTDPVTARITTAPIVEPVEGGPQIANKECRAARLPKACQTALRALREAVDAYGVNSSSFDPNPDGCSRRHRKPMARVRLSHGYQHLAGGSSKTASLQAGHREPDRRPACWVLE